MSPNMSATLDQPRVHSNQQNSHLVSKTRLEGGLKVNSAPICKIVGVGGGVSER